MKRIIVIAAALLSLGSASVVTATGSLASTSGAACVFDAPKSISLLVGHVGWGFELPNGTWNFGANDGALSSTTSDTREGNGSRATMLADFADAASGANAYTEYKCVTVRAANASAAQQEVTRERNESYSILYNRDCESQVYNVLSKYGVKNLPSDSWDRVPNNWFGWLFLAGFPANPASL